jgi:hypothetical protein
MLQRFLFSVVVVISLISCRSKTNQMVNHNREGKWITVDTLDEIYTIKGRYRKGNEVGTWKHYRKGILVKKEKYHTNSSRLTFYYPNGKIMKKGHTQLDQNEKEDHWYYIGDWYFYNQNGSLGYIKTYKKEEYKK